MRKAFLLLTLSFLLIGCNPNNTDGPKPGKEVVFTIDFTSFTSNMYADFDSLNPETFKDRLKSMMNSDGTIVDSIDYSGYAQYRTCTVLSGTRRALFACSSSKDGAIFFNFTQTIKSVTVYGQSYYSTYKDTWTDPDNPYDVIYCDGYSNLFVDENEMIFPTVSFDSKIEPKTISETFTINDDSLTLSGVGAQRAFIKKLVITVEVKE